MKVIKAKSSKAPAAINSLIRPEGAPSVERVLVVYDDAKKDASIYYEPPAAKAAVRP